MSEEMEEIREHARTLFKGAALKKLAGYNLAKTILKTAETGSMSGYPRLSKKESVDERIEGKYLAEKIGTMEKGLKIDSDIIDKLKEWHIFRVRTTEQRPPKKPLERTMHRRN